MPIISSNLGSNLVQQTGAERRNQAGFAAMAPGTTFVSSALRLIKNIVGEFVISKVLTVQFRVSVLRVQRMPLIENVICSDESSSSIVRGCRFLLGGGKC